MDQVEKELTFEYIRASGPGGQNVNKVSTAVQLRFDVARSPSLQEDIKVRLIKLAGKRVNGEGILLIEAKRYRSQEQNRLDALKRFREILNRASRKPRLRKKTRPTQSSTEDRLQKKKKRGEHKKNRKVGRFVE